MSHALSPADLTAWLTDARRLGAAAFAEVCFERLRAELRCERGAIISSRHGERAYHDAHYFGFPDIAATMASWQQVAHLDSVSPQLVMNPGRAKLQDADMPEIAGPECEPLRQHLRNHDVIHTLALAVCTPDRPETMTVFLLVRTQQGDRYGPGDQARLEALGPLVDELLAINRAQSLMRSPHIGAQDLPVALASHGGGLLVSTPAFARLMWPGAAPETSLLEPDCLRALQAGRAWPLADGKHSLVGLPEADGWLLRLRPSSRIDQLTQREREVAGLYAGGSSYKEISKRLALSPATVRNHLANIYRKLEVGHRTGLIGALS
ncbi:helix-turn-helix transcriptional regulator [Roseateles asaccharophilus]|uniref:DNA-binding CsgD family transcriptional regulator n=1 Tax=Roseateles asaccharophilus TaxID=582607 RepID=A0ABU2A5E9_9BURK|nr:helix-turn-helix transcriptional regulator [Roseateles asaccharophilus]MDR7332240.1 DNA-binding CsgD family transcriptional regulator [Roseateles asaccharophilus]